MYTIQKKGKENKWNISKIDPGEVASMNKSTRKSSSIPTQHRPGDNWHVDFGFGSCTTAIGGIKYSLFFVERATCTQRIYPLANLLTTSLLQQEGFQKFRWDCGKSLPQTIYTDFDPTLTSGKVLEYLLSQNTKILAAPPEQQHQNGLVERNWQGRINQQNKSTYSNPAPYQDSSFG